MSVFKLPRKLCKNIASMMSNFLMEPPTQKKEHSLEKWEQLETSKACGGLGFRNIETFNNAMLSKQLWRVLKAPNSLVAWIFKHKYLVNG